MSIAKLPLEKQKRKENTDLSIEERRIKVDCGVVCVCLHVGSISSYVI